MPTKILKQIKTYLSPENKRELERIKAQQYIANTSYLLERLLREWVERHGGTWTEQTKRGKYPRQPDDE